MNLAHIIVLSVLVVIIMAAAVCYPNSPQPLLVIDMRDIADLPGHFRNTSMPIPSQINNTGFADLHAIASRQYSKQALEKILQKLNIKKVLIVDLRQESHGFLNGEAISWYGKQDSANAGKKPQKIEKNQAYLLRELSKQKVATVFEIISKTADGEIDKVRPVELIVHTTASESELAAANQMLYQRFYVQDFHPPERSEVDRFIKFANQIPPGEWVYFHCRGGSGRSTTFMTMYDMMHNAKKVSFKDILARQVAIGGKDLAQLPPPGTYKYKPALKRLLFIEIFYQYCQSNNDHFRTLWSDWLSGKKQL